MMVVSVFVVRYEQSLMRCMLVLVVCVVLFVIVVSFLCLFLLYCSRFFFFFVKQKMAYDLRISHWSSDVCSSDLRGCPAGRLRRPARFPSGPMLRNSPCPRRGSASIPRKPKRACRVWLPAMAHWTWRKAAKAPPPACRDRRELRRG